MSGVSKNMKRILLTIAIMSFPVLSVANGQSLSADAPDQPFGEYLSGRHALYNHQYEDAANNLLKALELDPENVELNQFASSVLVDAGKFEEAIEISKYLQEVGEDNDMTKLLLFFEKAKKQDYELALADIELLSNSGVLNLMKPLFKAWLYADQGNVAETDKIIQTFDEESNFNFFNYFQAGMIYELLGNLDQAEIYYSRALSERGMLNLRAAEAYALTLRRQNKGEQAIAVYKQYINEAPANEHLKRGLKNTEENIAAGAFIETIDQGFAEMFYTVATILMQDNIKDIATHYLQYALYFKPQFPLAHFMQAQIFESDEYYDGAAYQLSKITTESPLYFQSKLQRAWLFDEMERSDETLKALNDMADEYPGNREVLNSVAEFYRMHERYAEAIPAYSKVINTINVETERDWLIYYTRGIVFDQEKRWDEAEKDFKKALLLRPEQPAVLNYLAYSWVDRGMNYIEAKKMLERAVELRPNDGYIVDSLGWALYKMGDDLEAVGVLERAAQLQTQDWAINDHLGDAYWAVGRHNEARFQWRHALSLSPDEDKIDLIKSKIKDGYKKPKF